MNGDYSRHHCGHTPLSHETQDPIMSHEIRSAPEVERKGSLMCAQSVSVFESATSPVDPSRALVENASRIPMAARSSSGGWGQENDKHRLLGLCEVRKKSHGIES